MYPAQPIQKEPFWNHLMDLHHTFNLPWCLIGDSNELANPFKKRGGQVLAEARCQRLNSFLRSINGEMVHVNGQQFTWKRNCILIKFMNGLTEHLPGRTGQRFIQMLMKHMVALLV